MFRVTWPYLNWEQDSSLTRQFTDTIFEDSSPTDLKTVHRHFWRQFIDTFLSCKWHMARKYNLLLWRNIDELWFEVICWYNLLRKRYFVCLISDKWTDIICYKKAILMWSYSQSYIIFLWNSPAIQGIPFEYLNRFVQDYLFIFK